MAVQRQCLLASNLPRSRQPSPVFDDATCPRSKICPFQTHPVRDLVRTTPGGSVRLPREAEQVATDWLKACRVTSDSFTASAPSSMHSPLGNLIRRRIHCTSMQTYRGTLRESWVKAINALPYEHCQCLTSRDNLAADYQLHKRDERCNSVIPQPTD